MGLDCFSRLGVFSTDNFTSDIEGNILHVARLLDT
jgi:hypothetical protein